MKTKIILALSILTTLVISCKDNQENKVANDFKKIDEEIANGISNLKDTLKIKRDTIYMTNSFNKTALDFNFLTLDDKEIPFKKILEDNKGKTIVIDFWASWCPDCIKGFHSLKKAQKMYPDASYIFISFDKTQEAWKQAINKYDLKGAHYFSKDKMNGEFGKAIDLDWIPRYIIINKEGKIVDFKSIAADDKTFLFVLKKSEKSEKKDN